MSAFSEIDASLEALLPHGKESLLKKKLPRGVTPGFNAALFAFVSALGIFNFLISERAKGFPTPGLILVCILDGTRFLIVVLITAGFITSFWRRLVVSMFPVRALNYQEAIAIILMLGILFAR